VEAGVRHHAPNAPVTAWEIYRCMQMGGKESSDAPVRPLEPARWVVTCLAAMAQAIQRDAEPMGRWGMVKL